MKNNKLTISIKTSLQKIWDFTLNPENTPVWIEWLQKEEASRFPPVIGTIYRNTNDGVTWDEYFISDLDELVSFTLTGIDHNYHVRYTFTSLDENTVEFEYFEWVTEGDLSNPFPLSALRKLKELLEQ